MRAYLAVDIGASSGRHILGFLENGKLRLEEIYRFKNGFSPKNGRLCWDIDSIRAEVITGLTRAKNYAPVSLGIDTWAVDFVLLDGAGKRIGDAVAYRDRRTDGEPERLEGILPFAALYARTGIQKQSFNTVYQLAALRREAPEQLDRAERFLMIPDYLNYALTGVAANEYTNASTTALVGAKSRDWDAETIARIGAPRKIFQPLRMAGEALGGLAENRKQAVGFDTLVRLAPSHDTASAFLAVPAQDENAVFLSSGTWSLMGVELPSPVTTPESRAQNFTNEGGYAGTYRFLKNIMGLWMLQSIRRELGEDMYSFSALSALAQRADGYPGRVDVNDGRFLAPESMTAAVRTVLRENGYPDATLPELLAAVYKSLAACYAETVRALEACTGRHFTAIHIVGGGSQDAYLNRLTADAAGLPVIAGPTEGTALGNLLSQIIADGALPDVQTARRVIAESFPLRRFEPKGESVC